jgi:hypothetical protein
MIKNVICNPPKQVMNEEWRDIPGYESLYQASNLGRIKRVSGIVRGGFGDYAKEERILKQQVFATKKEPHVTLCKEGNPRMYRVSNLICLAFIGEKPDGQLVIHVNGDSRDNRACNLQYGTRKNIAKISPQCTKKGNLITYDGVTKNQVNWSKAIGGSQYLVASRLKAGWPIEKAITTPPMRKRQ